MATQVEYSNEDIIRIAKAQRNVMGAVCAILLINIAFFMFAQFLGGGPFSVVVVATLFLLEMFTAGFYTFRLAKALRSQDVAAWIGAVLAGLLALTFVGLVVMAMESSRATKVLKARGLKVSVMGVSQQDIDIFLSK